MLPVQSLIIGAKQSAKRGVASHEQISALSAAYLHARNMAYPDTYAKPKHHYMMDLAKQILLDLGIALDCFTHERKLQGVKSSGSHTHSTHKFQRILLKQAVWQDLQVMEIP